MLRPEARTSPKLVPACAKVGGDRGSVFGDQADEDNCHEGKDLGGGEDILNSRSQLDAEGIEDGEERDDGYCGEVGGVQADIAGTDMPEPIAGADCREEDAKKLAEGDSNGRDGPSLDDEEEGPAVEKSPDGA